MATGARGRVPVQGLRDVERAAQSLRGCGRAGVLTAGTVGALRGDDMSADRIEAWTIPLHVVMWTALLVALVMVITVVLMN